jgi:putative membrane protein
LHHHAQEAFTMSTFRALTISAALVFSTACGNNGDATRPGEPRSTNPDTMRQQPDDTPDGVGARRPGGPEQEFVRKAMAGSAAEIRLAQLAQQKASSAGVKQLAQRIQQDHQRASGELQPIAQQTGVGTAGSSDAPHAEEQLQRLQALSGAEFDREYVELMVDDHQTDIGEFEKAARDTTGAVQQFAQKTLPVLREHLQLAEAQQKALR